jgi:hypothetical protein
MPRNRRSRRLALAATACILLILAVGVGVGGGAGAGARPGDNLPLSLRATRHRCTQQRPCTHIRRLGPTASRRRAAMWDTPERFSRRQAVRLMAWAGGRPIPSAPMGWPVCGQHFVLGGVVVGVATLCRDGRQPIHVQFTNVSRRSVTVRISYFATTIPRRPRLAA